MQQRWRIFPSRQRVTRAVKVPVTLKADSIALVVASVFRNSSGGERLRQSLAEAASRLSRPSQLTVVSSCFFARS